jgi:tetratricopeptide (TPR) repeat protein
MSANLDLCDPEALRALAAEVSAADNDGSLRCLAKALERWPLDPRIHFLNASCLAEARLYDDATSAFERAVDLQPDYAIARFQLGLLHLTSGRVPQALEVWGPLDALAEGDSLRLFMRGLTALVQERWQDSVRLLREGIESNVEFPPLNHDMHVLIERIASTASGDPVVLDGKRDSVEADAGRHVLLSEYLSSKTKH